MDMPFKVVALYKFAALPDAAALKPEIERFCRDRQICGTLLLAPEGINGTVAGTPGAIDTLVNWLMDGNLFGGRFRGAEIKYSAASAQPFHRMKVRLKSEIVTLKAPEADPNRIVGTYVDPADWNDLIANDDVIVLDTRNAYEVRIGTFAGAIDPGTASFTQFKDYVAAHLDPARDKKIAMFCTGGIRCEKASAYMRMHGFDEVYHLRGGILAYLEQVPPESSSWQGECFVFDERVAVTHGLAEGTTSLCRACRAPLTPADRSSPDYVEGVSCPHCAGDAHKAARAAERQKQIELAQQRGHAHLGDAAVETARRQAESKKRRRAR